MVATSQTNLIRKPGSQEESEPEEELEANNKKGYIKIVATVTFVLAFFTVETKRIMSLKEMLDYMKWKYPKVLFEKLKFWYTKNENFDEKFAE